MKRAGFTMIELIFVIVILGILAAVAIPKLAATRDDAKIAAMATNVNQILSDATAHYTATGDLNLTAGASDWDKITNVSGGGGDFVFTADTVTYVNKSSGKTCGTIVYSGQASSVKTITTQASDHSDPICNGVNTRLGLSTDSGLDSNTSVQLGGSSVTF